MPLLVNFTDLSTGGNITNWDWDFGDGGTSIEQNPSYEYTDAGLYTVSLTITASNGSDTETKTDYIEVFYPVPIADFEGTPTSGNSPLTVNFTDLSSGNIDTWFWDFGDGNSSTDQNPEYIYNSSGLYTVQLIVGGPGGSDTIVKQDYIIVYNTPVAEFDANPTTGLAPLLVNFTDLSTGDITDWQWAFGDGGFSNDKNPNHEYIEPGNYTVSLEVSGPGGNDTEVKIDYILIPVGLNEESQNLVIIYPNPTDNLVNIQFSNQAHRTIHIKNMSGRVVISKNTNRKQMIISLSKLSSGVYTFEIDDGKSIFTQKVIRK
jgi:PKD repeat protein